MVLFIEYCIYIRFSLNEYEWRDENSRIDHYAIHVYGGKMDHVTNCRSAMYTFSLFFLKILLVMNIQVLLLVLTMHGFSKYA